MASEFVERALFFRFEQDRGGVRTERGLLAGAEAFNIPCGARKPEIDFGFFVSGDCGKEERRFCGFFEGEGFDLRGEAGARGERVIIKTLPPRRAVKEIGWIGGLRHDGEIRWDLACVKACCLQGFKKRSCLSE